jgi:hypothetical protein
VLQPLGQGLQAISAKTNPAEVWYLTPEQHIAELIFFNAVFISGLYFTQRWDEQIERAKGTKPLPREEQQLTPILKLYRLILTACLCVTVCHKYFGNKLSNMFMPCHCATACYLYCLWTKDKRRAETAFNVSMHFLFYTFLAILMPDFRGLTLPGEIINFWAHHWILFIIPLHIIVTNFYHLDRNKSLYYYAHAVCWGGLVHFDIMGLAGLLSGLNVGYMLHPPKHTPFKGMWFRWGHASFLIIMGALCGFLIVPALLKLSNWIAHTFGTDHQHKHPHRTIQKLEQPPQQTADGERMVPNKQKAQ